MTFIKLLQQELKNKGMLTVDDVMKLSVEHNHYFDTSRRALESDKTPFAKKIIGKKGRIKGWKFVNPPIVFNKQKKLEQLTLI